MANKSRVIIKYDPEQPIQATVEDKDEVVHDISSIFSKNSGSTSVNRVVTNELILRHGQNSLTASLVFRPLSKDLVYEVEDSVAEQILGML